MSFYPTSSTVPAVNRLTAVKQKQSTMSITSTGQELAGISAPTLVAAAQPTPAAVDQSASAAAAESIRMEKQMNKGNYADVKFIIQLVKGKTKYFFSEFEGVFQFQKYYLRLDMIKRVTGRVYPKVTKQVSISNAPNMKETEKTETNRDNNLPGSKLARSTQLVAKIAAAKIQDITTGSSSGPTASCSSGVLTQTVSSNTGKTRNVEAREDDQDASNKKRSTSPVFFQTCATRDLDGPCGRYLVPISTENYIAAKSKEKKVKQAGSTIAPMSLRNSIAKSSDNLPGSSRKSQDSIVFRNSAFYAVDDPLFYCPMSETALEAMLEKSNESNEDEVVRCDEESSFYKPKMDVPQSSQLTLPTSTTTKMVMEPDASGWMEEAELMQTLAIQKHLKVEKKTYQATSSTFTSKHQVEILYVETKAPSEKIQKINLERQSQEKDVVAISNGFEQERLTPPPTEQNATTPLAECQSEEVIPDIGSPQEISTEVFNQYLQELLSLAENSEEQAEILIGEVKRFEERRGLRLRQVHECTESPVSGRSTAPVGSGALHEVESVEEFDLSDEELILDEESDEDSDGESGKDSRDDSGERYEEETVEDSGEEKEEEIDEDGDADDEFEEDVKENKLLVQMMQSLDLKPKRDGDEKKYWVGKASDGGKMSKNEKSEDHETKVDKANEEQVEDEDEYENNETTDEKTDVARDDYLATNIMQRAKRLRYFLIKKSNYMNEMSKLGPLDKERAEKVWEQTQHIEEPAFEIISRALYLTKEKPIFHLGFFQELVDAAVRHFNIYGVTIVDKYQSEKRELLAKDQLAEQ
ncbi:hypothetical protein CRE_23648 [Caenorhabditis remanei]|uniref:Uncharacterized protein n=1 Tax=Caenorhabditis remanei TaxID=31234 RepID=E3N4A0_CAERE|nr:hypothetical protein CRE_23648 [Caenorhabditis remanei]